MERKVQHPSEKGYKFATELRLVEIVENLELSTSTAVFISFSTVQLMEVMLAHCSGFIYTSVSAP